LLHASESVTSDADIRVQVDHGSSETDVSSITEPSFQVNHHGSSETDISSITGPSESLSSFEERGGGDQGQVESSNLATSRSVDEEPSGLASLLHGSESVTSDADIRVQFDHASTETDVSSIAGPSQSPPMLAGGGVPRYPDSIRWQLFGSCQE